MCCGCREITLPALSVFNREVKFIFPGIDVVVFDELKNAFSRAVKTETAVFRRISQPFQGVRSFDLSGVLSRFKPKLPILLTSPSVFQGHDVVTPAETWTPPQPVQVVVVLGVTLGANPLSLRVRTQLDRATDAYARSLERLSSGMRINRASDDAAGLAVSSSLNARMRVYGQAIRNVNDGISALNIAQGALGQMTGIVTRLRELSEQSANGVYSSAQRSALDVEASSLMDEYDRIIQSTSFNDRKLLDGRLRDLALQLGYETRSFSIGTEIGKDSGTGQYAAALTSGSGVRSDVAVGDLNGDGFDDSVSVRVTGTHLSTVYVQLSNGDGTFSESTLTTPNYASEVAIEDINNDGRPDIVAFGYRDRTSFNRAQSSAFLGNGNGTFGSAVTSSIYDSINITWRADSIGLADVNGDGNLDLVFQDHEDIMQTGEYFYSLQASLGNGSGGFTGTPFNLFIGIDSPGSFALGDLNGDNLADIAFTNSAFEARVGLSNGSSFVQTLVGTGLFRTAMADFNGDGNTDLVFGTASEAQVYLNSGSGSSYTLSATLAVTDAGLLTTDLNRDGFQDIIGYNESFMGNGDGTFGSAISHTGLTGVLGDFNGDQVDDLFATGGTAGVRVYEAATAPGTDTRIERMSIATQLDAREALEYFSTQLEKIGREMGSIGSSQSRLRTALNNLSSSRENYATAFGRIQDADIAQESASMIRSKILQQTANAVLSQANLAPEIALNLLKQIS